MIAPRIMSPQECQRIALQMLWENGLPNWRVTFGNAKQRAGTCLYDTKRLRFSKVILSAVDYESSLDTIRHEVAHAIAGKQAGHGASWKAVAVRLGGSGNRCWSSASVVNPEALKGRYFGTRVKCGRRSVRHGKPRIRRSCYPCNPKRFDWDCVVNYVDAQGNPVVYRTPKKPRRRVARARAVD